MKNRIHTELLAIVICLFTGTIFTSTAQTQTDYLYQGLEAEQAQEYEKALEIWFDARQDLDIPSLQISTEYLRIVTEHELRDYYPMAFAMYQWGLSAEAVAPNHDALADEISRIAPITEEQQTKYWRNLLQDKNSDLYREIEYFWRNLNSLPVNNYNPHLLEHWERIAYAREHFNAESLEPYGTDIRGKYYVKYGQPNKTGKMDIAINPSDVQTVFSKLNMSLTLDLAYAFGSTSSADIGYPFRTASDHVKIWKYDIKEGGKDLNLTLFFEKKRTGVYEQIMVIDDLIPSTNFLGSKDPSVGLLQQWVYYDRLKSFDDDFARINEGLINDRYREMPGELKHQSDLNFKFLNRGQAKRDLEQAPAVASTDRKLVMDIPVNIRQYRLLNDHNEPIFVTYVENKPLKALYFDLVLNTEQIGIRRDEYLEKLENDRFTDFEIEGHESVEIHDSEFLSNYQLRNSLHLRGEDMQLITSSHNNPVLVIDKEDENVPSVSIFEIPYIKEGTQQVFFAELRNHSPESSPAFESTLPANLRGLGKVRLPQPEHFVVEPGKLIVSDLILGYQKHEVLRETDLFPFIISHDNKIPSDESIIIHFEAYQLGTDDQGLSRFEVDYSFSTVSRFFNLFGSKLEGISSTIAYEHDDNRFAESLELQTTGMAPGKYDLSFTVTDKITGDSVERNIRLEVINNSEFYVTEN